MVVDLLEKRPIAVGVIRTEKAHPRERLTASLDEARRGCAIRRGITRVLVTYDPKVTAIEGAAGSKSASAASKMNRAQQAVVDAIDEYTGGLPLMPTPQSVKQRTVGRLNDVTKEDLEEAAMRLFPGVDWERLARESITGLVPPGKYEHFFDAGCVIGAVWDEPAVTVARRV